MNENVILKDVMNREFVGVSESDEVGAALGLMREESAELAVVLHGQEPAGVLTAGDVIDLAADGAFDLERPVGQVMSAVPPVLSPESSLDEAVSAMSDGIRAVIVCEGDEMVGLVDARDVVTASASLAATPEQAPQEPVEQQAAAVAGDGEYSNQSICEICGSLTRELSNFNGQLICSDCLEV